MLEEYMVPISLSLELKLNPSAQNVISRVCDDFSIWEGRFTSAALVPSLRKPLFPNLALETFYLCNERLLVF